MTSRRIKWLTYWNFIKLTKHLPYKPERTIIKSMATMSEAAFEGLMLLKSDAKPVPVVPSVWGILIVEDDRLEPDDWYLDGVNYWHLGGGPCPKCADTGFVIVHGPEDYGVSFESEACECEIGQSYVRAEESLCGCGHGDYRTCPCEDDRLTIRLKGTPMRDVILDKSQVGPIPTERALWASYAMQWQRVCSRLTRTASTRSSPTGNVGP